MELLILGSGPSRAIPRPGHRDAACAAARRGGRSRRSRSAALLTHAGTSVLIDAGPDIAAQMVDAGMPRIDAALLTHAHGDATDGLAALDAALGRRGAARVPVHARRGTCRTLARRFPSLATLAFAPVRCGTRFRIGSISCTPFEVRHSATSGFPTCGYAFGTRLAYASDVASLPRAALRLLRGTDTLVLDGAMYLGMRMPTHLAADDAIMLASVLRVRRLILTQIGHSYPPHGQAEREIRRRWRQFLARRDTRYPADVSIAFDGMRIRS